MKRLLKLLLIILAILAAPFVVAATLANLKGN